jgi:hypothetical protein
MNIELYYVLKMETRQETVNSSYMAIPSPRTVRSLARQGSPGERIESSTATQIPNKLQPESELFVAFDGPRVALRQVLD